MSAQTVPYTPNARRPHDAKVDRIASQLRQRTSTAPVVLEKKAVSHQVPKARDPKYHDPAIDVSDLDTILDIDVNNRRCIAESGVTFVDLVKATLPHGLIPALVPELKTITVGGAVSGCSVESTSFRLGGFHDTCTEYEVITGTGDVIRCRPDGDHALLFQMMHGTFGTLGILAALTFDLLPAKPFVRTAYVKHDGVAPFQQDVLRHFRSGDVTFMDGLIHSGHEWVLAAGSFVDEAPYANRDRDVYWIIEDALPRFGGLKTLISHNRYSKEEFWKIWNKDNYQTVKAVTDPRNVFLDLYEKTCRPAGARRT